MSMTHILGPGPVAMNQPPSQATYRLLLASLGNFLNDLEHARYPFGESENVGGLPVSTWQDANHLYMEGNFEFRVDSGREVDIHVLEGKFFIRLAKD